MRSIKFSSKDESEKHLKQKKRLYSLFKKYITWKSPGTEIRQYLGVEVGLLREWIESNMTAEMNWGNYGKVWVIDHIVPIRMFDIFDKEQLAICWHYKNLMPLLLEDNEKKNGNVFFSFELLSELRHKDLFFEKLYQIVRPEVEWMVKYIDAYHIKWGK